MHVHIHSHIERKCIQTDTHIHIHISHTHSYKLILTHTITHTIGSPEEKEEGGSVYEVLDHKGRPIPKGEEVHEGVVTLSFGR